MSSPNVRGLNRFQIPQRLYILRTNMLAKKLDRLYVRYMNGGLIKSQVNLQGQKYIREHTAQLKRDVDSWFTKSMRGFTPPNAFMDIDAAEREKIREWEEIVNDM